MSYVSNVNEKENIFIFWEKEVEAYHRWIKLLKTKKEKEFRKNNKAFYKFQPKSSHIGRNLGRGGIEWCFCTG